MVLDFGAGVADVVAERGLWYGRLCTSAISPGCCVDPS